MYSAVHNQLSSQWCSKRFIFVWPTSLFSFVFFISCLHNGFLDFHCYTELVLTEAIKSLTSRRVLNTLSCLYSASDHAWLVRNACEAMCPEMGGGDVFTRAVIPTPISLYGPKYPQSWETILLYSLFHFKPNVMDWTVSTLSLARIQPHLNFGLGLHATVIHFLRKRLAIHL